jgi:hypothetical protein
VGTGNFSYGPIAILGNTTKASVLILGDSRDWGVGDVNYIGTSGGAMPTFVNGIARLFVPYYGFCNVSQPYDRFVNYTGTTNRMFFTNFATVIWTDLGINEFTAGTPSLLLNVATNFYRLFSVPVCAETLSPYTTSSDGFFTVANQTVNGNDTYRTNFNALLRNHMMPNVSHYCDVDFITESDQINAQNSGKWNVWASSNFNGSATFALTNMGNDGLHGDYFGVLAAGMGDPLHQETPYIPTGLFPTVLTASGTFTGNGIGLTNQSVSYFTNFVSGLTQTNTGTKTMTWKIPVVVSSPATTLGNAEVDAQLQLPAGGAFVSIGEVSIAGGATSIIATNKDTLVFDVPPGWGFQVTNTVSGVNYVAAIDSTKTNQVTFHP